MPSRFADRILDARGPRVDVCPHCGRERRELPPAVVADRFYCSRCEVATVGPNSTPPANPDPEPQTLFDVGSIGQDPTDDRPPIDDYDLEPLPDEA